MSHAQATVTTHHDGLGQGPWTPVAPVAGWWSRAAARLIDEVVLLLGLLPFIIGLVMLVDARGVGSTIYQSADPARETYRVTVLIGVGLMGLGGLLGIVVWVWNRVVQQGGTGQSFGKAALKIVLVSSDTGKPIGTTSAFLREITHVVDGIFAIGYLWPLWDRRNQTLADKLVGTVVTKKVGQAHDDGHTWAQRALA
jgi:uncharacterized RDD family membrane protein YckC